VGRLQTRIVRRRLRNLKLLDKNARYMRAPVFQQLVDNITRDGVLTQLPTIHEDVVLSGNHRVQAAIKAGLEEADCIEVLGELGDGEVLKALSHERAVAIQLSHNALTGEDDPNMLAALYEELPLEFKTYSGITDDMLRREDIDLSALSAGGIQYQEVQLVFLPEEATAFVDLVERMQKLGKKAERLVVLTGTLGDWDGFFDTLVRVKDGLNIKNTAIAIRAMAELAADKLDEIIAATQEAPGK
jgi:hypothetical protein